MQLTSNETNMIRSCLSVCVACSTKDCIRCPMYVDPIQLIRLTDGYMDVMLMMHKFVEDYKQ